MPSVVPIEIFFISKGEFHNFKFEKGALGWI